MSGVFPCAHTGTGTVIPELPHIHFTVLVCTVAVLPCRHRHCHNIEPADYEDTLLRTLDYAANKVKNDKRRLLSLPGGHTMIDYPFVVAAPSY